MSDYHGRIMNIPAGNPETVPYHFKKGHQSARHAAAEIATEADAEIDALRLHLANRTAEVVAVQERRAAAAVADPDHRLPGVYHRELEAFEHHACVS